MMADRISARAVVVLSGLGLAMTEMFFANPVQAQQTKSSYDSTADVQLYEGPGNFHKVITSLPKVIQINVIGKASRIGVQTFLSDCCDAKV